MYNFNERTQRLEPTENKCLYCQKEHSSDMENNCFVWLFKEHDRTNIVVYRSVKYKKIEVGIPRCNKCMKIHQGARAKAKLISWGISLLVILLIILMFNDLNVFVIVIGFVGALAIGLGGSHYLKDRLVSEKGILTEREGALECELITNMVLDGWSFNQPTA